jgi:hypothetical protein
MGIAVSLIVTIPYCMLNFIDFPVGSGSTGDGRGGGPVRRGATIACVWCARISLVVLVS